MTKNELLEQVNSANVDANLKKMVLAWISTAYDCGFYEGMKRTSETHKQSLSLIIETMR